MKNRRRIKIDTFDTKEKILNPNEHIAIKPTPTSAKEFIEAKVQADKQINARPPKEGDEYTGPKVEFRHDGATKAAEAKAAIAQGKYYPADKLELANEDELPPSSIEDFPEGYRRINLPSGCIFYDFKTVGIRPLTVKEAILVTSCCQEPDILGLHDVLNATVTCDIRKLWWADYIYILFWHRLYSYTKVPYRMTWTSIYGNERSDELSTTSLSHSVLKITEEEWENYKSHGFSPPSVKSAEQVTYKKFGENDWKLFSRAQFLEGEKIEDKLANLDNLDMDSLILLKEFSNKLNDIGIQEFIQVCDVDLHSNWDNALKFLEEQINLINELLGDAVGFDSVEIQNLNTVKIRTQNELTRLQNSKPGEAEPLLETIKLSVNELTFLPRL